MSPASSIGVDIGGTKLLGVVLSADGEVLVEQRAPTPHEPGPLIQAVAEMVASLDARTASTGPSGLLPLGVGAPGLVTRRGQVLFAPNLGRLQSLELIDRLQERFERGRRIVADNDATCAGWGEATYGAARGAQHAVIVTLGTGIGGGIVSEGRLLRGSQGFAGEIGHMVIDTNGPICPCGRSGCWERYASGSGLGRLAREAAHAGLSPRLLALAGGDPEAVRGEHVTAAAGEGDPGAIEVMGRFAGWLAIGLANLANAFDPELIVIGGGLVQAGEVLMGPTRLEFARLVEAGTLRPSIEVLPAALGERAGAIGAATLASIPGVPGR